MASFRLFDCLVQHLAEGRHDFRAHKCQVSLTADEPQAAIDQLLEHLTGVVGQRPVEVSGSRIGNQYRLAGRDFVIEPAGAPLGPFRYVVLFNQSAAGAPLIGYWDYGSTITLAEGETLPVLFGESEGVLQLGVR